MSMCRSHDVADFSAPTGRLGKEPVEVWLAFACDLHRDELLAPRELLDRDHAVLADWREREQRALDGKG